MIIWRNMTGLTEYVVDIFNMVWHLGCRLPSVLKILVQSTFLFSASAFYALALTRPVTNLRHHGGRRVF